MSKRSPLISLSPAINENGIMRAHGRRENSELSYEEKHPIILPSSHDFTRLLIRTTHLNLLHGCQNVVWNTLRCRYLTIHGKNAVRTICRRINARIYWQLMGEYRVTSTFPFAHVGVDLAGLFDIRNSLSRSRSSVKAYFAVSVCAQTKAIHIELTTSLTADAFLIILNNFISRRGLSVALYSDNGSNLTGADNQLEKLYQEIGKHPIWEACRSRT